MKSSGIVTGIPSAFAVRPTRSESPVQVGTPSEHWHCVFDWTTSAAKVTTFAGPTGKSGLAKLTPRSSTCELDDVVPVGLPPSVEENAVPVESSVPTPAAAGTYKIKVNFVTNTYTVTQ